MDKACTFHRRGEIVTQGLVKAFCEKSRSQDAKFLHCSVGSAFLSCQPDLTSVSSSWSFEAVFHDYLNFWNAVDWVSIICATAEEKRVGTVAAPAQQNLTSWISLVEV